MYSLLSSGRVKSFQKRTKMAVQFGAILAKQAGAKLASAGAAIGTNLISKVEKKLPK